MFLTDDALLLLAAVGDALGTENRLPIFGGDFDLVFYGSVVFELRFLCYADELLDVVPFAPEQRGIVRYGVIGGVNGGYAAHDCEFSQSWGIGDWGLGTGGQVSCSRFPLALQASLQITPRRGGVEQVYDLDVGGRSDALTPVGVKDGGDFADGVGRGEAAVTGFLTQEAHNLCAVLVENKHTDGKAEVLEVLTDAEEVCGEVVVEKEVLDFLFYGIGGDARIIPQPCAIADLGVEALAGGEGFVFLYEVENIERHLIVAAPRDIGELIVYERRHYVGVLTEHRLRIDGERCTGFKTGQLLHGAEI